MNNKASTHHTESKRSHALQTLEVCSHYCLGNYGGFTSVVDKIVVVRLHQLHPSLVIHEHSCKHRGKLLCALGELRLTEIWITKPGAIGTVGLELLRHSLVNQVHTLLMIHEECVGNNNRVIV